MGILTTNNDNTWLNTVKAKATTISVENQKESMKRALLEFEISKQTEAI